MSTFTRDSRENHFSLAALNPFQSNVPFLYPLKSSTKGFLTFLGGIEIEHWAKMVNKKIYCEVGVVMGNLYTITHLTQIDLKLILIKHFEKWKIYAKLF